MLKMILSVVFFVDIFLGYLYIGPVNISYYDGRNLTMANIAIQSGISINATVTHVNPNFISLPQILALPVATSFRLSRFLRPLLFIESANDLRKEVLSIGHVIHSLLPVLFLIFVWIFLFSMLGVIFFPRKELAAMAKVNPTMGDLYFTDLYHGMITWMNVFFGAVIWPNVSVVVVVLIVCLLLFSLGSLGLVRSFLFPSLPLFLFTHTHLPHTLAIFTR